MAATMTFITYCGLLVAVLALTVFQGALSSGIVSIVAALLLAVLAATSLPLDHAPPARLVNRALIAGLLVTCLTLLLQIVPLSGGPLINPIWISAATALGDKPAGFVTIDLGMTLLTICRLGGLVAIGLLAALLALRRQRADQILSLLTIVATLVSLACIVGGSWLNDLLPLTYVGLHRAGSTIGMFGVVLSVAVILRSHERWHMSRSSRQKAGPLPMAHLAAATVALLVNLTSMGSSGDVNLMFASLFGAGMPIAALVIRKGRLSPWGQAGTAAVLAIVVATFITFVPGHAENEAITRMTDDARPLGSGAGTVAALAPIYGEAAAAAVRDIPVATTIAIAMGKPFLCLIAVIAAIFTLTLLRAALKRGRDYVYPACGSGCIAALLISAVSDDGSLELASAIMLSAVIGLAVAQSKGDATAANSAVTNAAAGGCHASTRPLRMALAAFAVFIAMQGLWTCLPEVLRPAPIKLPTDQRNVTASRQDQQMAIRSATVAYLRGDLWAESAFTEAAIVWTDPAFEIEANSARDAMTSTSLLKALHYAPHRGDVWLMLAATCGRLKLAACNHSAFLKMSYYTAPDRVGLLPLRLAQALLIKDFAGDDELLDMVRRDIRSVLVRSADLRPALIAAYRNASPAGRRLVEQTVSPVAPGYLTMLRSQST